MTENSNAQLVVKARFNFQQTNEDELSFSKGDIINVTRTEEGGWWEGSLNGKTGWFPSNYVREVKGSGMCQFAVDQCFSTGGSQDHFEWVVDCTVKEMTTNLIL